MGWGMFKRVINYCNANGREPIIDWLRSFKDKITRQRIEKRIERLGNGNYGNHKRFFGIIELRFDFGKGYRIYCADDGPVIIILLAGGNKSSQEKDISLALRCWEDYNEQKKIQDI
jgi:putative addiction module killer protein